MTVAHLGPPLARTGGPAGYLLQLRDALAGVQTAHRVLLPAPQPSAVPVAARPSIVNRLRARVARTIAGGPRFYRASHGSLQRRGGELDTMLRRAIAEMGSAAEASLNRALAERADVLFAHDLGTAVAALDRRAAGQSVWLMLHSPMSAALYLAWSWGVPEQDWRTVLGYPDVRFWTAYEVEVLERVDRLVVPCREAADDLARCDARFAPLLARADLLPTGGSRGRLPAAANRAALRAKWRLPIDQPVGLIVGTLQPYRGFDALAAGLTRLEDPTALPGTIAVAGPERSAVPAHERVRALGRVDDMPSLLAAVDFVVNVNRFSLFDLSLVEALEAARLLLLHDAGGNRAFRALGAGCVPIQDLAPASVAAGLERCFSMTRADIDRLGRQSRACYDAHLTPAHFARRHLALYDRASHTPAAAVTA